MSEVGCHSDARDVAVVQVEEGTSRGSSVISAAGDVEVDAQSEPDQPEVHGSIGSSGGDFISSGFGDSNGAEVEKVDVVGVSASPGPSPSGNLGASRSCHLTVI